MEPNMEVVRHLGLVAVFVGLAAACEPSTSGGGGPSASDGGFGTPAEAGTPDAAVVPATDAAVADAAADAPAGDSGATCTFVGTWTGPVTKGPFAGGTVTMVIVGDGTFTGTIGAYSWGGMWTLTSNALTVVDITGTAACPSSQVGGYTATFAPSCNTADFAVTSDLCAGRALVIDMLHLTRS
jgi:hypothetical protein